ncbi:MAG TPA: hypothetical protein VIS07_13455 [Candidatus Binatia bacterium]
MPRIPHDAPTLLAHDPTNLRSPRGGAQSPRTEDRVDEAVAAPNRHLTARRRVDERRAGTRS